MANKATAKKSKNDFNMEASSEDVNDRASFQFIGILRGIIGLKGGGICDWAHMPNKHSEAGRSDDVRRRL
jgi:hypothetical protein